MSRRALSLPPSDDKVPSARGRCISVLCFSWKIFTCIFSHVTLVTLVVGYCLLGAFAFERLEADNEKSVKINIKYIRNNVTEDIWKLTFHTSYLFEKNWTINVVELLKSFETDILNEMQIKGWDGIEDENKLQWTFEGALFYSIIVITTIGYGHIAPKTSLGKVTTIFYAILGIPLMLLCLSNIGDIMASSFRFIYWRICCFVCTREAKKARRHRAIRGGFRQSRTSSRYPNTSMRRSMRISQRSADSGFDTFYETIPHSHSDTELRYNSLAENPSFLDGMKDRNFSRNRSRRDRDRYNVERERTSKFNKYSEEEPDLSPTRKRFSQVESHSEKFRGPHRRGDSRYSDVNPGGSQQKRNYSLYSEIVPSNSRKSDFSRYSENAPSGEHRRSEAALSPNERRADNSRYSDISPAGRSVSVPRSPGYRAQSLDQRGKKELSDFPIDKEEIRKTPILCNKYAIDCQDEPVQKRLPLSIRSQSLPRSAKKHDRLLQSHHSPPPTRRSYDIYDDNDLELQPVRRGRRREHSDPPSSPRIMSPMGIVVNRQTRQIPYSRDTDSYEEDWDIPTKDRPVPIWLCVLLVVGYILTGAFLFHQWEKWSFLDSAYFCFITLTTIGFGDFVPAQGVQDSNAKQMIALCSLYLLFGIALLAMSFNLVQEEFITNVKTVAKRLGILKDEEEEAEE